MLPRDLRALAADAAAAAAGSALLDAGAILAGGSANLGPHTAVSPSQPGSAPTGEQDGGISPKPYALRVEQAHLDTALAALKQRTATDVRNRA